MNRRRGEEVEAASLPKRYQPIKVEAKWQAFWLKHEIYEEAYRFHKDDVKRPVFVIDTPPPFTSGKLHMGHAYWNILNDNIARYKRMRGHNVLLPQGWDCQGLPTELKVQDVWGVSKEDRGLFRQKCVEWTEQMIVSMKQTMTRLGYRPDWEQFEYRTMDKANWRIVQSTLLQFLEDGLIFRELFPVHWCPHCETALAQAELGYIEQRGTVYYIRFPVDEGFVEVATTRPELIPACQALAIHPDDERYVHLEGTMAEVVLFERRVPIIVDEAVDPAFGSGVVMVCTFGDEQDVRWQQKHNLPVAGVVDEHGKLMNAGKYSGLTISEARKAVASDLKAEGYVAKQEEVQHKVLCHAERSDCLYPIEFLVKPQFFIKSKAFKDDVIRACRAMQWRPEHFFRRLVDWVNSIEWDWLISRQRVYGTPLPFWYCEECNKIIPAKKEQLPVDPTKAEKPVTSCPRCGSTRIKACEDVCDCWVDSSITPLIISGYFHHEPYFQRSYPANIRQQGHDIIRTWLYYTTLRCLVLTGEKPFWEVVINGHILGPDGYRMSKSRGNVVDPEDKIDEYGADAIRQALLSLTLGSDFSFNWDVVKYCKGFLQKYWSALRFAHRFIKQDPPPPVEKAKFTVMDRWILSKLGEALQTITENMETFQFHTAIHVIQNFVWHDVCDQYLEAVKYRLYNKDADTYDGAIYTLHTVLWNITRALAPICPHITEEVYQTVWVNQQEQTIHACKWPEAEAIPVNKEAKEKGDLVVEALTMIRTQKAKIRVPLNREIERITLAAPPKQLPILRENEEEIKQILHINGVTYEAGDTLRVEIEA